MADVPFRIQELVQTFGRNIEAYRSQQYKETQLRREFIDPFFEELGWDVTNKSGYAEAYKDVVHEDAIKVGRATKAPDYCFRIGGVRKFFLEAKKPSVDIKADPHPAYQLRRYAWSAKLPLSILTDFEEFAVYDCQNRPRQTDKSSTARIMFLTYKDYLEDWDKIADIFSKDAVLKGSFDKFVVSPKGKRGTTSVDAEFLAEIEKWREMLARIIALRNRSLSVHEVNFAVQRTIDRILFLRMCEDRGIEEYGQLLKISNGKRSYPRLCEVFEKADQRYNSGLFHFSDEPGRPEPPDELTLNLVIDDKDLQWILYHLYYPQCPYEFSVLPPVILGNVYEQFLGKVISVSPARRVKIEAKPEVKKAGGVYYTPGYIVDYIVKNTVGKFCEGKTPRQISRLKILDPACGSGSFLLGAYTSLLDYHRDWYTANDPQSWLKKKNPPIYQAVAPTLGGSLKRSLGMAPNVANYRLTVTEKKRILLNNIFGVDIDSQAVEVTKLSLLLKVLEGENQQTLENQYRLFHERALPDLGNNIKCGNSLIGPDFFDTIAPSVIASEAKQSLSGHCEEAEGRRGNLEELRTRVNAFDWQAEFPEIFNRKNPGFDAVVGNPPYGAEFPRTAFEYLKANYDTCVWRGESYLLFVEKAIGLLNIGGNFGYIIPDTYLNLRFTDSLRTLVFRNTLIREVLLLPAEVFPRTTVDTTLLLLEKATPCNSYHANDVLVKTFRKKRTITSICQPDTQFLVPTRLWYDNLAFLVHSNPREIDLVSKIESANAPLSSFGDVLYGIKVYQIGKGTPPQTEDIRNSKPFTSQKQEDASFLPMFDGKHIGRYMLLWDHNNWVKYGPWLAEPRGPEKYEGPKLLIRKIVGRTLAGTYVAQTSYCNTLVYVVKLKEPAPMGYLYLLGVLNSRLIGWYFHKKFQISDDDTFPQILIRDILRLPIPLPPVRTHDIITDVVNRILNLHRDLAAAKVPDEKTRIQREIDTTDKRIDELVYDLYGLTDEEIAIVEGRSETN